MRLFKLFEINKIIELRPGKTAGEREPAALQHCVE
jgi:hypothetical protein